MKKIEIIDGVFLIDEYDGMDKLEVKGEEFVDLCGKNGFPKDIEVEDAFMLRMIESNCRGVDSLRIGAKVIHLTRMEEAPKVIELTEKCDELWLNGADVSGTELKLEKGGDVLYLAYAKGIKPGSDFSGFDHVELNDNDMKDFASYKFKDGARVDMVMCSGFPKVLDLSKLQSVDLRSADLSGVEEIIFREGAIVDLSGAKNFPKTLDLSKCEAVRAKNTNLTGVKKIVYKDNEQASKFINEVDYDTYPCVRIGPSWGGGGMGR